MKNCIKCTCYKCPRLKLEGKGKCDNCNHCVEETTTCCMWREEYERKQSQTRGREGANQPPATFIYPSWELIACALILSQEKRRPINHHSQHNDNANRNLFPCQRLFFNRNRSFHLSFPLSLGLSLLYIVLRKMSSVFLQILKIKKTRLKAASFYRLTISTEISSESAGG